MVPIWNEFYKPGVDTTSYLLLSDLKVSITSKLSTPSILSLDLKWEELIQVIDSKMTKVISMIFIMVEKFLNRTLILERKQKKA